MIFKIHRDMQNAHDQDAVFSFLIENSVAFTAQTMKVLSVGRAIDTPYFRMSQQIRHHPLQLVGVAVSLPLSELPGIEHINRVEIRFCVPR